MTKYAEVRFITCLVGKTFIAFSNCGTGLKPSKPVSWPRKV